MDDLKNFKVNAQAIAYLLNNRKDQSFGVGQLKSMIAKILLGRNPEAEEETKEFGEKYISIHQFEEAYSHYPILNAIASIRSNYLKHPSTYNHIMEYPLNRLSNAKNPLKKIRIPSGLRDLLTNDQKNDIVNEWTRRYSSYDLEFLS